jgi:hypothetical protein
VQVKEDARSCIKELSRKKKPAKKLEKFFPDPDMIRNASYKSQQFNAP